MNSSSIKEYVNCITEDYELFGHDKLKIKEEYPVFAKHYPSIFGHILKYVDNGKNQDELKTLYFLVEKSELVNNGTETTESLKTEIENTIYFNELKPMIQKEQINKKKETNRYKMHRNK